MGQWIRFAIVACVAAVLTPSTPSAAQVQKPVNSATKARDINGFSLGMQLADVRKRATVQHVAFETFEASYDGITYQFGVTPLGRIFRIESQQDLGRFELDRAIVISFRDKMIAKYGPPNLNQQTHLSWWIDETVTDPRGAAMGMATHRATATLVGANYTDPAKINMHMIDFRILWQDERSANAAATRGGEAKLKF